MFTRFAATNTSIGHQYQARYGAIRHKKVVVSCRWLHGLLRALDYQNNTAGRSGNIVAWLRNTVTIEYCLAVNGCGERIRQHGNTPSYTSQHDYCHYYDMAMSTATQYC